MSLRVERRDGSAERLVLIGMVVSRAVLGPISVRWQSGLFPSRYANIVAGWCVEHYRKYARAPHKDITGYFDAWAEANRDREVTDAVEQLLAGLSEEYERLKKTTNPDYVLDQAARLFNRTKLAELKGLIEADLETGGVERAEERVSKFRRVELGLGAGIEVLTEVEAMKTAFEDRADPLVVMPGALGDFFGPALGRDQLIGLMAKEKGGKSFWLHRLAWAGVEQGRRVAFFECGDMSQSQVLRRVAALAAGRPLDAGRYEYPVALETNDGRDPLPDLKTEWRDARGPLTPEAASKALARLAGDSPDRFRLSCHPNCSISVTGIETVLDGWERDGWTPDCVVIDYADILMPLDGRQDSRDQINATWMALRALSQKKHCLVLTASQANKDSYSAVTLSRENVSEDKRKYSHVTGMVGINQTAAEKNKGLFRLNWIVRRDLDYSEKKCVWAAGCLAASDPCVLSTF